MRRLLFIIVVVALLLGGSTAGARPDHCIVVIDATTRDATVAMLQRLLGASLMIDGTMIDLGTIQATQALIATLNAAPSFGCGLPLE